MLPLALWLALTGPATAPPACDAVDAPSVRLGPASAPLEVEAFIDPASSQSWRVMLELRRLAADHGGELRIHVRLAGRGGTRDPAAARVRAFVASLAGRGHLLEALELVARDGIDRTHARVVDPAAPSALARDLGVETSVVHEALRDRCAREAIASQTRRLLERLDLRGGGTARMPMFVIGPAAFDDGVTLERLRPELGRQGLHARLHDVPPPLAPPPPVEPTSDRMRRPPLAGLELGGPGLPHRFVLMARGEDDPNLFAMLPTLIQMRRSAPGTLAVQLVARGASSGAERLRHRLCAARRLGLGSAYAERLALDASMRPADDPVGERLRAALDEVPAEHCDDEVDPVDLDLPDGAWLDGLPRSRPEMEALAGTLRLLDASWRPLDLVWPSFDDE